MIKNIRWVALLLVTIMLLLPVSSVSAAVAISGFTTWSAQTTNDVKKVWTISFKSPFLNKSVTSNTIYVKDSKQVKIAATIKPSTDGLSATVTPTKPYAAGDYNLYVTNGITSQSGIKLGEQIILPFTVIVIPPATPIVNVQSVFSSYGTEFTVKTTSSVYKVNVNNITMRYAGDSTYNADLYGLKQGSTITFQAYDQNGVLLQTYKYLL